ncbi:unnamed protein product [Microthlaspi erraticum]|uniref:F-box associated beta-propeller type 3 domain-containing protein n=1 Tax=Microthlaspi erraticum TaxID=1685480 RepID=A0A6D2KNL5_9BRAS|nr:unnamed protein product [Microthlaspi erraticum]
MLRGRDFTRLFLTRSQARPRLLILLEEDGPEWSWNIYSSPQPQNPYEKSSLVVSANFHTKIPRYTFDHGCAYASGLILFPNMWFPNRYFDVVCDPMTGQYAILPEVNKYSNASPSFLGFDPFGKQFKVFAEGLRNSKTLILDDVDMHATKLVNYKGKLGGISWEYGKDDIGRRVLELRMWVKEDVEEPEWLEHVYTLSDDKIVDEEVFVAGVTARGDIVLSMNRRTTCKPFYVFYFNPESNALQNVEIEGFGELHRRIIIFVDHVEDIRTLNIIKTSARTEA